MVEHEEFGSSEGVLRYIQEMSDDIEKAVIPQSLTLVLTEPGSEGMEVETGMVLHMLNGHHKFIHPVDAELILNDGILNRMNIKIELFRGKS